MYTDRSDNNQKKRALIVGAGCFGLSTALYLLNGEGGNESGNSDYDVTVIDASPTIPAPDAASSDLNKIVRGTYADPYYTLLAKEAIALWKQGNICGKGNYRESGVLVLGLQSSKDSLKSSLYTDAGLKNDLDTGARVRLLPSLPEIRSVFSEGVTLGPKFEDCGAYLNADGGWAVASNAMKALLQNVKDRGGNIIAGAKLANLLVNNDSESRVTGVMLKDGSTISADIVVLAAGAWSTSIPGLPEEKATYLTFYSQTVATVRLEPEMAERYRQTPVLLDFSTGFYMFPPNDDNVVKFALHTNGHTWGGTTRMKCVGTVSTPRTSRTHGDGLGTRVPADILKRLHDHLKQAYPELGALPLDTTRLCWYLDTPDEDWIIDEVDGCTSLFVATGGSGHAFKFLPVIGRLVKSRIEGRMEASSVTRFSMSRKFTDHHGSRHGMIKRLEDETLWGADEFNENLVDER
ncbi:hypothetical protein M408DRAFT_64585 [Serendipita vermifera MAFF 305830]|uniref:FAD dependent oxidoreductase domain-containing protein n=1 Tax=Serendipita vermifera MAFF 305830 TaxID=933852 RepID=A0A0C3B3S6_SERVB|nr:hypothetical protein M408DRAFT_64585 [Serendipita vermifera MAFF 305830]